MLLLPIEEPGIDGPGLPQFSLNGCYSSHLKKDKKQPFLIPKNLYF